METVNLSSLSPEMQAKIRQELGIPEEKKELFPIAPRSFLNDNFQTKEIRELGQKVDELIVGINELHKRKGGK